MGISLSNRTETALSRKKIEEKIRERPIVFLLILSVVTGAFFLLFPRVDLAISGLFFDGVRFPLQHHPVTHFLREALQIVMLTLILLSVAGLALRYFAQRQLFSIGWRRWLFVALCLLIGPGLVANTLLKDNWGRPRPVQTEDFGGNFAFAPPVLIISDACQQNCSFVSGEGAMAFMTGFVILGLFGLSSNLAIALALLYGAFGSALRIMMGGHYFSDTLFAGLFMAMIAIGLYRLLVRD